MTTLTLPASAQTTAVTEEGKITSPENASETGQRSALTDIDGRTWGSEDLAGKLVLYDFWATWCPPCLAELPHLRRLQERFDDPDLLIVGIAMDSIDRRGLRSFLLRHNIQWPQIHAASGAETEIARRFGVEAVPATVLLDRQGRLVARNLRGRALEAVIETLVESNE